MSRTIRESTANVMALLRGAEASSIARSNCCNNTGAANPIEKMSFVLGPFDSFDLPYLPVTRERQGQI